MLSKGTSDKSPSVSTTSGGDLFGNSKDELIRELLLKVLNVDLFREIEQDPNLIYEIMALLKKPNSLVSSESIVCFILQLDPLLDQFGRDLQKNQETLNRLSMQTNTSSQQRNLVLQSKSRMSALKRRDKEDNDRVAACDAYILQWEQEIK
jgi:hypothetical protein